MWQGKTNESNNTDLRLKIRADRNEIKFDEPLTAIFTIENISSSVQVIESADTSVIDIVISESGKIHTTWSAEHPDLVIHRLELQPGESKIIQLRWKLRPGEAVSGTVMGVSGLLFAGSRNIKDVGVLLCVNYC